MIYKLVNLKTVSPQLQSLDSRSMTEYRKLAAGFITNNQIKPVKDTEIDDGACFGYALLWVDQTLNGRKTYLPSYYTESDGYSMAMARNLQRICSSLFGTDILVQRLQANCPLRLKYTSINSDTLSNVFPDVYKIRPMGFIINFMIYNRSYDFVASHAVAILHSHHPHGEVLLFDSMSGVYKISSKKSLSKILDALVATQYEEFGYVGYSLNDNNIMIR